MTATAAADVLVAAVGMARYARSLCFHAIGRDESMNLTALTGASAVIQIHTYAALAAFLLGLLQFAGTKGVTLHRLLGYAWAALMLVVAGTAFWIHEIRLLGPWSPIHLLALGTLIAVPAAVLAARRRRTRTHRDAMIGLFVGALVVAGVFTFVPGRIMHALLFGGG